LIQSRPYNSSHRWSAVADLHTSPVITIDIQQFKEYKVGDMFYRKRNQVRTFKSVQEKETYKINIKLAA
jgi:hypothetical protein